MANQNAKRRENYPSEPSIRDVETWLDWQAHQLETPCWGMELTAIPRVEDRWKLAWKIWSSFSIPAVRTRVFLGQGYTAPPAPKCLTQNVFLPDELSYQDMQQQPFLLTEAYAQGLQYWAEILNLPVDLDFCPLARSVLELKEMVKEHVVFPKKDITQGLGRTDLGKYEPVGPNHPNQHWKQGLKLCWGLGGMSPHPHHLDPSLRGDTPPFPQLDFKWRANKLGKMPALLRQPLKLPLPQCQGSN